MAGSRLLVLKSPVAATEVMSVPRGKPPHRAARHPIPHEIRHSQSFDTVRKATDCLRRALRPDQALTIAVIAATLLTMAGIAPLLLMTEVVGIMHASFVYAYGLPYTPIAPTACGPSSAAARVFRQLPAVLDRSITNWSGHSLLSRKRCDQQYARRNQHPYFHRPSPSARCLLAAAT